MGNKAAREQNGKSGSERCPSAKFGAGFPTSVRGSLKYERGKAALCSRGTALNMLLIYGVCTQKTANRRASRILAASRTIYGTAPAAAAVAAGAGGAAPGRGGAAEREVGWVMNDR